MAGQACNYTCTQLHARPEAAKTLNAHTVTLMRRKQIKTGKRVADLMELCNTVSLNMLMGFFTASHSLHSPMECPYGIHASDKLTE